MSDLLAVAAAALRTTDARYPWIYPTDEEAEVAELLVELAALHVEARERCTGCSETWPCKGWLYGQELAVQWLGRASTRVYDRAKRASDRSGT
jgi:hypothetical protein